MTYRGSNLAFPGWIFSALYVLSFLLEVVLFSFQGLVYKYCMKNFFEGDNSHVTKPRARQLGLKCLLMSSLEGTYGCVPPKTAPSYMYICWVFFPNSELNIPNLVAKSDSFWGMFVIFISHQWLGAPWPNVTTTLTRDTRTIFERSRPFYG